MSVLNSYYDIQIDRNHFRNTEAGFLKHVGNISDSTYQLRYIRLEDYNIGKQKENVYGKPSLYSVHCVNALRQGQNGRHFADEPFKRIILNETLTTSIKISLNFVPKGPINNI